MTSEERLFLDIDRVLMNDAFRQNALLSNWERDFLRNLYSIYRKTKNNKFSLTGVSQSKKNVHLIFLKN